MKGEHLATNGRNPIKHLATIKTSCYKKEHLATIKDRNPNSMALFSPTFFEIYNAIHSLNNKKSFGVDLYHRIF